MDITTIIGVVLGVGLIIAGIGPSEMGNFFDTSSIMIVIGGTASGLIISYPTSVLKQIPAQFKILVKKSKFSPMVYIDELQELATIARKSGLLSLEDKANEVQDPFFKQGIMLIVDATTPEKVREFLHNELEHTEERHGASIGFYERGAAYAPGFGLIGTLIGLINMLMGMSGADADAGTSALTSSMGVAMITTFYGSVLANLIFLPIAKKLEVKSEEELLCKRIIIAGILAIQEGENPKFLREKLITFLPEREKNKTGETGEAGEKGEKAPKKKKEKKEKKEKK